MRRAADTIFPGMRRGKREGEGMFGLRRGLISIAHLAALVDEGASAVAGVHGDVGLGNRQ